MDWIGCQEGDGKQGDDEHQCAGTSDLPETEFLEQLAREQQINTAYFKQYSIYLHDETPFQYSEFKFGSQQSMVPLIHIAYVPCLRDGWILPLFSYHTTIVTTGRYSCQEEGDLHTMHTVKYLQYSSSLSIPALTMLVGVVISVFGSLRIVFLSVALHEAEAEMLSIVLIHNLISPNQFVKQAEDIQ